MIKQVSFEECLPLLRKLWEAPSAIYPIDNFCGLIDFLPYEYEQMRVKYFLYLKDGRPIGTTYSHLNSPGALRIAGTFVEPEMRRRGIARELIFHAIASYEHLHSVVTFPREGSENFYRSLGFIVSSHILKPEGRSRSNFRAQMNWPSS